MMRRSRWCWACSTKSTACDARCGACATRSNSSRPKSATQSAAPSRPPEDTAANRDRGRPARLLKMRPGRPRSCLPLKRLEAGLGAAFDAGGDQLLDLEPVTDQFEHPQFLLARLAIRRRHIAGDRIGGLAQFRGQRLSDRFERFVEPIVAA